MTPDMKVRPAPPSVEKKPVAESNAGAERSVARPEEDATGWLSLRKPQVNLHWRRSYVLKGDSQ